LDALGDATIRLDRAIVAAMPQLIHKTAQPLTLLRGLLELMLVRVSHVDERESLAEAVEAVRRLTTCFREIRTLAGLQRPEPDIAGFPLSLLVTDVLQKLESDIEIAGVNVLLHKQRNENVPGIWVNVPQSRASFAIRFVLTALLDSLHVGDRLQVFIDTDGSKAKINLRASTQQRPQEAGGFRQLLRMLAFQIESAQPLLASAGCEVYLDGAQETVVMSWPTTGCYLTTPDPQREAMHV
jgi:hypothetical protein